MRGRVRVTEDPGGVKGLIRGQAPGGGLRARVLGVGGFRGQEFRF